jgi:ferredoxin
VDRDACMECGACARNCPVAALRVRAGVGCAAAVINGALGRGGDCCCE